MKWNPSTHSANVTDEYLFHQLIPYIGNKRKLLDMIGEALMASGAAPDTHHFVDLFAGTGVVSRWAKQQSFAVLANDWEPFSEEINACYLELSEAPTFFGNRTYQSVLDDLNALPSREDWVTKHLCPRNDDTYDVDADRMFYMRKNGQRIDAIRHRIEQWDQAGDLNRGQRAALLAPLLYQACYTANTSGVFKGFHNGWGGQTRTALYRIKGDLALRPARFCSSSYASCATRQDAQKIAETLGTRCSKPAFVYLDPPYNQHPYGANYHVLNSIALWDKPALSPQITGRGDKAAIRTDWRTERRSAYNYAAEAAQTYKKLVDTLAGQAAWIATSYSTDGMIALRDLIEANHAIGDVRVFMRPYKRYRVSSQRYSPKPLNIEFVLLTETGRNPRQSVDALTAAILKQEQGLLAARAFFEGSEEQA